MKILIIGGTVFLGRHIAEAALSKGHELTLFNRGQHNPGLFPEAEKLKGDRKSDLSALKGKNWDVVIDTCGYVPKDVRNTAEKLEGNAGKYIFISSISVYSDFSKPRLDESSTVGKIENEDTEEITGETYGPLKALCENAVTEIFGENALNIRPGLIAGPDDPSDRFSYWVYRLSKGGEMLLPGRKNMPVQYIDVRDLSEWIVKISGENASGTFNATGPGYVLTFGNFINAACEAIKSRTETIWADESFLLDNNVSPWMDLPLWVTRDTDGIHKIDVSKAVSKGLTFREISTTVKDTLAWMEKTGERFTEGKLKAGLDKERERELIKKWKSKQDK